MAMQGKINYIFYIKNLKSMKLIIINWCYNTLSPIATQ